MPTRDQEAPGAGDSPYQGLNHFGFADAHRFFGREQLTAELAGYLHSQHFLAVVGASGSGKSSLVRAGLIPALHYGQALADATRPPAGSRHWPIHIMQPKAHPLRELAAALLPAQESDLAQLRLMDELAQDGRVLGLRASRLLSGGPADRLLLVVDQFEELFTLCKDPAERKAFVDNLLTAAVADGVTTVVITLRADFYAHCFAFDNLRTALGEYQIPIGPMKQDELRRAIEEPARLGRWELEPGLVALLLADVGDEPGALPLLSHALLETWKRRRGRTLTLAGYAASGRVQGAIAHTAEAVFNQLDNPQQQAIAKSIFLRLTELGEGAEDTRRRVQLSELMPKLEEQATIEAVLTKLADARLVTTDKAEVEVAHEALIRKWPTLRGWLDENREGLRLYRRLTKDALEWDRLHQDPAELYRGLRLEQAVTWERTTAIDLAPLEKSFLKQSKALHAKQLRQRRWTIGTAIAAALLIIGLLGSWLLIQQSNQATLVLNQAIYIQLQAEASAAKVNLPPEVAEQKLIAANDLFPGLFDLDLEIDSMRRYVATAWVEEGEQLAKAGNYEAAGTKFRASIDLTPPADAPIYIWIKAGEFTMGSTDKDSMFSDEDPTFRNDKPPHTAFVDGFWIGRTEVTNSQYIRCIEAKICDDPDSIWLYKHDWSDHPVVGVTWHQARTYAKWVGGRLPTEAEWEKACRGTDSVVYPWGDESPTYERANYGYNQVSTSKVGSHQPGANGLYDMAGNVWEWTNSKYQNYDPRDGQGNQEGAEDRMVRGGSWASFAPHVRCAIRLSRNPDSADQSFGLRVVISASGF